MKCRKYSAILHGCIINEIEFNAFKKLPSNYGIWSKTIAINASKAANLEDNYMLMPDIFVVKYKENGFEEILCVTKPELVIEVCSIASKYEDKVLKKDIYERMGVKEYILIEETGYIYYYLLNSNGKYELVSNIGTAEELTSKYIPNFKINLKKLSNKIMNYRTRFLLEEEQWYMAFEDKNISDLFFADAKNEIRELIKEGASLESLMKSYSYSTSELREVTGQASYLVPKTNGQEFESVDDWCCHIPGEGKWELFGKNLFSSTGAERDTLLMALIYNIGLKGLIEILPEESIEELKKILGKDN